MKQTVATSLVLGIAGLVGSALFVYANPDLFVEMMIIIGPFLAAIVAGAIVLALGLIARAAFKTSWRCLLAAGPTAILALVLSVIYAAAFQEYIMAQWRLHR